MGLVSGMVMGTIVGIALMAGWSRMMRHRSTKRVAKAADIKVLGSLSRDDLRKLCGDNFPEWISFPSFEQVKWLNKQLSKMWPFVAEAARVVVKETVEPLLDDYRPAGIKSLKFNKFFLGNVPPKIEGIKVQSLTKGQIIMDIDFRWGGDPSIILGVDAVVASLPIQLKDLQVFTVIRVVFQLCEEIPCISAVVVALLADPKPRIDYTLKAVGGSLTAIPGLNDMIDDTVDSIVTDMLQWPHRLVIPLGGVDVDISDLELKPQGRLSVTVIRANNLMNTDIVGKSDPYVVLYVRPMFKVKTKVIDNNLNPEWNETFEIIVEDKETQYLVLEVYDDDNMQQDTKLGVVKVPLQGLELEAAKDCTLKLERSLDPLKSNKDKKERGTITVQLRYHQFTKEEAMAALELEKAAIEQKKKMKEAGLIGSTMDAVGGVAGSAVGLVGTGIGAGVGLVGTGIGAGVGLVGTGIGAGVGLVGTGFGAVGSGFSKAGKFMGRAVTGIGTSKKNGASGQGPEGEAA
ncbi:Calcium-dependent lipid-binding (CaLB domain) family protein [Rhynchospora pubera]|uniref:Calcium-dependent lipid-binding (CaLB domain) family protein n=1 Tax=Rhynchospora pubera TaxID=906938 RepID=A0AAV8EC99_9POAL|nr:Calcium-dependent lipid-binding (CaLB domain) family protein [Rhynchospora pubera]